MPYIPIPQVITSLLDADAQVSAARKKDGATSLHLAAAHTHPHIVKLLLDNKASPNLVAQDGCTALMLAARSELLPVCYLLLSHL